MVSRTLRNPFGGSIKSRTDFGFKGARVVLHRKPYGFSIKTACAIFRIFCAKWRMLFLSENHGFSSAKLTAHACFPIHCVILLCGKMCVIVKVASHPAGCCICSLVHFCPRIGCGLVEGTVCGPSLIHIHND